MIYSQKTPLSDTMKENLSISRIIEYRMVFNSNMNILKREIYKKSSKIHYIQSIAWTKYVNKNGSITQNHSGRIIKNPIVSNRDTAKYNQYFPVDLVVDDIVVML